MLQDSARFDKHALYLSLTAFTLLTTVMLRKQPEDTDVTTATSKFNQREIATPVFTGEDTLESAVSKIPIAVASGIALLNRHFGEKWPGEINLETLCLSESTHCMLGQLGAGEYEKTVSELGLKPKKNSNFDGEAEHGFCAP